MKRAALTSALALAAAAALPGVAHAGHNADVHSNNMSLIANFDDGGTYRQGSDLAFWGDTAILGSYGEPGGFRVMNVADPARPVELGQMDCPGPQNDVSIWRDLVFLSVDSPRTGPECGAGAASAPQQAAGQMWEGVRIFSIANPSKPVQIKAVGTDCGSHTHTLHPDEANNRVLIYVQSYPLGAPIPSCHPGHQKISVIEVPLNNPAAARVVSTPNVGPAIGCHDSTVLMPRKLVGAACISESQMWDVSDPVRPRVLSHIVNPAINIQHSTTFTWDGNTMVIGDELGGAEASPGCGPGGDHVPFGALWFYDVKNPNSPQPRGAWRIPQTVASALCTAHNFNTIPLLSGRHVLASAWYDGGTTVTDFSDPTAPVQIGHYQARQGVQGTSWSSYWYNDRYFANNWENQTASNSRGFDVFSLNDGRVKDFVRIPRLNPQTQEPLPGIGLIGRGPPRGRCRDRIRPRSSFNRRSLRRTRRGIRLTGRASDRGCGRRGRGRVSHVIVAIARRYGKRTYRCSYLRKLPGRARADRLMLGRRRSCRRKTWIVAGGTTKWRYRIKARLPRGLYNIRTKAVDSAANFERRRVGTGKGKRKRGRVNVLWFRVR